VREQALIIMLPQLLEAFNVDISRAMAWQAISVAVGHGLVGAFVLLAGGSLLYALVWAIRRSLFSSSSCQPTSSVMAKTGLFLLAFCSLLGICWYLMNY